MLHLILPLEESANSVGTISLALTAETTKRPGWGPPGGATSPSVDSLWARLIGWWEGIVGYVAGGPVRGRRGTNEMGLLFQAGGFKGLSSV